MGEKIDRKGIRRKVRREKVYAHTSEYLEIFQQKEIYQVFIIYEYEL